MLKKIFCRKTFFCFALCFALCAFLAGCADFKSGKEVNSAEFQGKNQTDMKKEETIFACNPSAMNKEQRARYSVLTKQLFASKTGIQELPDGYAVGFSANPQTIKDAAEFITYERLCCPFLNFEMTVEGENLSLRLKGEEGVKEFLKAELRM